MITGITPPAPREQLSINDCTLLSQRFGQAAQEMFPVPVSVKLYLTGQKTTVLVQDHLIPEPLAEITDKAAQTNAPVYQQGTLIIPQLLEDGGQVFFVFTSPDKAQSLLKKLSSSWLAEFQDTLHKQIMLVRETCIDPVTGLHNSRALDYFLQATGKNEQYALFLINLSFARRTAANSLRKIQTLSDFFAAVSQGILFFGGQGIFALLTNKKDHHQRISFGHTLQRSLRREAIQKVHIACGITNSNPGIREQLWQALQMAERRGPYGICDIAALKKLEHLPFALPEAGILRKLRRKWLGLDCFGLAIFQAKTGKNKISLADHLTPFLTDRQQLVANTVNQVFVLFPSATPFAFEDRIRYLIEKVKKTGKISMAVGSCYYPCLQFSKTDTIRNCRKAIMHGSFYDSARLVSFDHLTLNISGDWYFDEGDFRQAVKEYSLGLQLKPGEHNLLNSLGVSLIKMNRYKQAIETFQQVIKEQPDDYMALVNLGYAQQVRGNDDLSLEFFKKAFQVQRHTGKDGLEVYQQLSRLYCQAGQYKQALPFIKLWQQEAQEKSFLFYRLQGEAFWETGCVKEAMKSLQHALQLHAHDPDSMSMLGLLYIEHGEGTETGNMLLKKALSINERSADCWYRYGRALKHQQKFGEASDALRQCLRIKVHHIRAILLHGELLANTKKISQARLVLKKIFTLQKATNLDRKKAELLLAKLEPSLNLS